MKEPVLEALRLRLELEILVIAKNSPFAAFPENSVTPLSAKIAVFPP